MAINQSNGVFPPRSQGGVPNTHNICNGYQPINAVVGDGPLYVSPDCTTTLTDCQTNAWTSELFSAVDLLGYSYNTGRITNLGDALVHRLDILRVDIDTRVRRSGDAMTGPLDVICPPVNNSNAACKLYVDQTAQAAADACCTHMQSQLDNAIGGLNFNFVRRDGDQMTGPLILSGDPTVDMGAATKEYVDNSVGGVLVAPEPPTDVPPNRLWWSSSTGGLFIRYFDGTSTQWVEACGTCDNGAGAGIDEPVGTGLFGRTSTGLWEEALPLTGGTLTGQINFAAGQTINGYLPLNGGTLTGPLTINYGGTGTPIDIRDGSKSLFAIHNDWNAGWTGYATMRGLWFDDVNNTANTGLGLYISRSGGGAAIYVSNVGYGLGHGDAGIYVNTGSSTANMGYSAGITVESNSGRGINLLPRNDTIAINCISATGTNSVAIAVDRSEPTQTARKFTLRADGSMGFSLNDFDDPASIIDIDNLTTSANSLRIHSGHTNQFVIQRDGSTTINYVGSVQALYIYNRLGINSTGVWVQSGNGTAGRFEAYDAGGQAIYAMAATGAKALQIGPIGATQAYTAIEVWRGAPDTSLRFAVQGDGSQAMSYDGTGTALDINNIGTGNSLVIHNGATNRFTVDSDGVTLASNLVAGAVPLSGAVAQYPGTPLRVAGGAPFPTVYIRGYTTGTDQIVYITDNNNNPVFSILGNRCVSVGNANLGSLPVGSLSTQGDIRTMHGSFSVNDANPALDINNTGTGNSLQIRNGATNHFVMRNDGTIELSAQAIASLKTALGI